MFAFGKSRHSELIPLVAKRPAAMGLHINERFPENAPPAKQKAGPYGVGFLVRNKVSGLFSKLLPSHDFYYSPQRANSINTTMPTIVPT
jgi:hypothetical protein